MSLNINELEGMTLAELHQQARELNMTGFSQLRKRELILAIMKASVEKEGYLFAQGLLDIMSEGFGFLRPNYYLPSSEDI